MTATDGVITAGSLTVTKVSFLRKFVVDTASISYAQEAPNAACSGVLGSDIWRGKWQVQLPRPPSSPACPARWPSPTGCSRPGP
jgi:hypothetical protein